MTQVEEFVGLCLAQQGDPYVFGAEANPADPDPKRFDCSELVEWALDRLGVEPSMPDGSWIQARHCRQNGTLVSIGHAISTRGALLFRFDRDPFRPGGRPSDAHVAVSLGDGTTIEARGKAYGTGVFKATGRPWTHAALVPGLDYGGAPPVIEMPPATPAVATSVPMVPGGTGWWKSAHPMLSEGAGMGAPNEAVKHLQACAGELVIDGQFGPNTKKRVRALQKAHGIEVDGIVGPVTWARLHTQCQEGDSGGPVGEVQTEVGAVIDGEFGPNTRQAVEAYQGAHGCTVDGVVGPQTYEAMGR